MNAFQTPPDTAVASLLQLLGAGGLGLLLGWNLYFINRYRSGEIQLSDLATVIGAVAGAAILAIFPAKTDLFGAYGIGLALGFFLYFIVLLMMVGRSPYFGVEWFLDGRRKLPEDPTKFFVPDVDKPGAGGRAMGVHDTSSDSTG